MDVFIAGMGSFLPSRVVTNEILATLKGIDADWISKKTGIHKRFIARHGVGTPEMASAVAQEALAQADVVPEDLGLIVVASAFHPSFPNPTTSEQLRRKIGAQTRVFDLTAPDHGFLTALEVGYCWVARYGTCALVVGAEGFSHATDLKDRRTCYQLSDGAGAVVLSGRHGHLRLVGEQLSGPDPASFTALLSNEAGSEVHVIGQLRDSTDFAPTSKVKVHDPFSETGDLLSAALPLSLISTLQSETWAGGDRLLLSSVRPDRGWSARRVEVLTIPQWPARRDVEISSSDGDRGPHELDMETLRTEISAAVATPACNALALVWLDLDLSGAGSAELQAAAEEETRALLRRQTRQSDTLFKLAGKPAYALLLRHLDENDCHRICARLQVVLENLDPAGEVPVRVAIASEVYPGNIPVGEWACNVVARLASVQL
jgi:3-Oxoacyl-[acyl-carrier-protein (ACP)] synthase III